MIDREIMQQALDALEYASDATKPEGLHGCDCLICKAIPALRDRLAQPEQGPVAWRTTVDGDNGYNYIDYENNEDYCYWLEELHPKHKGWIEPLYTTPPAAQRPWVGLTDEDIFSVLTNLQEMYNRPPTTDSRVIFAYAIEAKLKEKNT